MLRRRSIFVFLLADTGSLKRGRAEPAVLANAWPGNVHELRNALERATILGDGGLITSGVQRPPALPPGARAAGGGAAAVAGATVGAVERELIVRALREARRGAARWRRRARGIGGAKEGTREHA